MTVCDNVCYNSIVDGVVLADRGVAPAGRPNDESWVPFDSGGSVHN